MGLESTIGAKDTLNACETSMRVLIVGYVWPEPNSSAAGGRMLSLIEIFKMQGWLVTFASPAADSEHAIDLESIGVEKKAIALNCSSFDDYVLELQPDIVLFDRFMMEEQFGWRVEQACPNALRLLDTEDLHCLREARQLAVKQGREFNESDLNSGMALREVASILRCDLSLMISEYEMDLLQRHFRVDASLLLYVPFMIDIESVSQLLGYSEREHFVCIGNFRHAPNWDSVLWLNSEVWPLIRKQIPNAQMHVYGAYPPKKAMALHNPKKGFHVLGWADDSLDVLGHAKVCLAPLRFGAGIKGKFADAMLAGTPSVTTPIGVESMCLYRDGEELWSGRVARDAESIALAATELYQDENEWLLAQHIGHEILRERFDKSHYQGLLNSRIAELQSELGFHRGKNFTGAMLRHHHHRSTQFMSQWIEVKGRLAEFEQ